MNTRPYFGIIIFYYSDTLVTKYQAAHYYITRTTCRSWANVHFQYELTRCLHHVTWTRIISKLANQGTDKCSLLIQCTVHSKLKSWTPIITAYCRNLISGTGLLQKSKMVVLCSFISVLLHHNNFRKLSNLQLD